MSILLEFKEQKAAENGLIAPLVQPIARSTYNHPRPQVEAEKEIINLHTVLTSINIAIPFMIFPLHLLIRG